MRLLFGGHRVLSTNTVVILSDAICVELMKMPETKWSGQPASSAKSQGKTMRLPVSSEVGASWKDNGGESSDGGAFVELWSQRETP